MTVLLVRHGRSTANIAGVLAGRSPGVGLDDIGSGQADELVDRLASAPVVAIVRSPLLRCEQTVAPLAAATGLTPRVEDGLIEVGYGEWTGRRLAELAHEPLWSVVQRQPSAARFPGGESLAEMATRAVATVRRIDAELDGRLWVACSHGDVIKAIIADAAGSHLDAFQRIVVAPASISVVEYGSDRPYLHAANVTGAPPVPAPRRPPREAAEAVPAGDAVVGGGV